MLNKHADETFDRQCEKHQECGPGAQSAYGESGLSSEFIKDVQIRASKPGEKRARYGRLLRDNHVIGFLVATKETIISLLK